MNLKEKIAEIFKDKINFLFICGSYLRNKNKESDIDIFCCVNSFNKKQEQKFRDVYFSFHRKRKAKPDFYFPGELVTLEKLKENIKSAKQAIPNFIIKHKEIYDGLVWSGMLVDKKELLVGRIPENILSLAYDCIKKWNNYLFNENTLFTTKLHKKVIFDGDIELKASVVLNKIIQNKKVLLKLLLEIESYETAKDEFFRSIDCLENIKIEKKFLASTKVKHISAFFPVNLPLYSLIIFGFIPSLISEKIFIRAPEVIQSTLKKIKLILFENNDSIYILQSDRKTFVDDFVKYSEVIFFTGRYFNIKTLEKSFPDKLIIYNGAGINPIIVNKNVNLNLACDKVIQARIFNSGQDCAGPDTILVHSSIYRKFLEILKKKLKQIIVGNFQDLDVQVGKLLKPIYLDELGILFKKEKIVFGGKINKNKKIIYPTIISKPLNQHKNYKEFFSPIFWISEYKNELELKTYFETKEYLDYAMYVSIFGNLPKFKIPNSIVLKNKIVMDVERGNLPYGGYGKKAQFMSHKGERKIRPILISKEISEWKKT